MRGPSNYYGCLKHNQRWTKTLSRVTKYENVYNTKYSITTPTQ